MAIRVPHPQGIPLPELVAQPREGESPVLGRLSSIGIGCLTITMQSRLATGQHLSQAGDLSETWEWD